MSSNNDKSLILNKIKTHYNFKKDGEFAKFLGIAPTTYSSWLTRNSFDYDLIYAKCENISADFLLTGEGSVEKTAPITVLEDEPHTFLLRTDRKLKKQQIPLYEFHAAAGLIELFGQHKNVLDYIVIPNLPKADGAIFITGDSMYPLLKSGDMVIYKQINNLHEGIVFGEMHILSVYIDGDLATVVKFVQKSDLGDEYIKLVSQNNYHAERHVLLKNITAIALVKASIRYNTMM